MLNADHIASRYLELWNETDPERRRALIASGWTEDASYLDPLMRADTPAALDALVVAVHERFPGHRFTLQGSPDGHNDRVRFSWSLAADGAPPLIRGTDFVELADDGRIRGVTGFIDEAPADA